MFKSIRIKFLIIVLIIFKNLISTDVNIVGLLGTETTAPLISTVIADILSKEVSVNFISSRPSLGKNVAVFNNDMPLGIKKLIINKKLGPISLLTDVICYKDKLFYERVPNTPIKIAYSMFETNKVPQEWVDVLNNIFDAVVVPHESICQIYINSGVNIPVFVIPLPIFNIEELLKKTKIKNNSKKFIFSTSAGMSERKNYNMLLDAFAKEFSQNQKVELRIHVSWGNVSLLVKKIKELKLKNVVLINKIFNRKEYTNFLASSDCYVFASKGEGFSITPREALALAIPTILLNHTVHKDLAHLKSVIAIPAEIKEPAYFEQNDEYCGYYHQCDVSDLQQAFKTMYRNYSYFSTKVADGKQFVKQWSKSKLLNKFVSLIKPCKILLGDKNYISLDCLTTNNINLYEKYKKYVLNNSK